METHISAEGSRKRKRCNSPSHSLLGSKKRRGEEQEVSQRSSRALDTEQTQTRTHAAKCYSASACTVSEIEPLFNELSLLKSSNVDNFKNIYEYELEEIMKMYGFPAAVQDSEMCCKQLVASFFKGDNKTVEAKQGVAVFKVLPECIYTNRQVPDVALYLCGNIILIIEVHSGNKKKSFVNSIKKTIMGLIDILRYYKGISPKITKCVGFTFPKLGSRKCVVEVVVEFKNFQFTYQLSCITLCEVKTFILTAINGNHQRFKRCFNVAHEGIHTSFVRLSDAELKTFQHFCDVTAQISLKSECIAQYPSKEALLISYNGIMWKFPVRKENKIRLDFMSNIRVSYLINVSRWCSRTTNLFNGKNWFYYSKIEHKPLIQAEAAACIGPFMTELCGALKQLHELEYAHLDVRLENICFDDQYKLVLVDLDRCSRLDYFGPQDVNSSSCIYPTFDGSIELQATMTDWKQVGYLLLWVYTWEEQKRKNNNYHSQDLLINHSIVKDQFFCDLIKGNFNSVLLKNFCDNHTSITIGNVLKSRK